MNRLGAALAFSICCAGLLSHAMASESRPSASVFDLHISVIRAGEKVMEPEIVARSGSPVQITHATSDGQLRLDFTPTLFQSRPGEDDIAFRGQLFERAAAGREWVLAQTFEIDSRLGGDAAELTIAGQGVSYVFGLKASLAAVNAAHR